MLKKLLKFRHITCQIYTSGRTQIITSMNKQAISSVEPAVPARFPAFAAIPVFVVQGLSGTAAF